MKNKSNKVHAVADCRDCDWCCENLKTAQSNARYHSARTGHTVRIEVAFAYHYKFKPSGHKQEAENERT